jgi:2-keto-4-pentenoate hydratase/2-oxohepta-3-ene-1,7-dioic acid hydratase in catechol pathway
MRLIAFDQAGNSRIGLRLGDEIVDLTALGYPATLDALLLQGADAMTSARGAAGRAGERLPLSGVRYLPPLTNPSKAIAVGLNYVDHAAESPYKDPPKHPILFHRFRSSWVAHQESLVRPHVSSAFDYEGEMVVVIGKAGRYIDKAQALDHVAGYSIFNEGSIRDYQLRTTQWTIGKNFDKSGGFGPELVTADELPPGAAGLRLRTRLNGETLQDASTKDMIFDVSTLIAACSEAMALQPGDIIISGTPAGVGFARKPPIFMKPGDICEVEIEDIGVLRNGIVDEST